MYVTAHCVCGWADRDTRYIDGREALRAARRHALSAYRFAATREHSPKVRWHDLQTAHTIDGDNR